MSAGRSLAWALSVALWLLAACGESRQPPPVPAAPPAPLSAAKNVAPVSGAARAAYQWYCAQCHGIEGKGDGINAKYLAVPPRDHTKADYLETRTDEELMRVVKHGGLAAGRAPCMPVWGHTLDDDTIASLVRYIRELCRCEGV